MTISTSLPRPRNGCPHSSTPQSSPTSALRIGGLERNRHSRRPPHPPTPTPRLTLTGPGSLEDAIAPRLDEWRTLAQRDAVYIVALTQIERTEKRGKKQAAQGSLIDLDN